MTTSIKASTLALLWLWLSGGSFGAPAQSAGFGTIAGSVTDASGAVIPGVTAKVLSEERGFERATVTDDRGAFVFSLLPPGTYLLRFELPGFAATKLDDVRLLSFQTLYLPVSMQVGAPDTVVKVAAHSDGIDTLSPTARSTLPETAIRELPVLTGVQSRSALDQLQLLFPGAGSFRFTGLGDSFGNSLSINGSALGGVGFYVDGIDNNWEGGYGAATIGPNPDAIEELTVLGQNFRAEAGGHQAQVHWRTRGGTDEFHGLVRALQLNPRLGARDFFDREKSSSPSTNAFGFNAGGPLVVPGLYDGRHRTFWFFDTEWTRWRYSVSENQEFPGDSERAGDFGGLPQELWPIDPSTGRPFPGGRIPESRIVRQARFYVDEFIPRDPSGGQMTSTYNARTSGYQFTTKLEHHLGDSDTLSGSLFLYRNNWRDTDPVTVGNKGEYPERGHNFSLQYARRLSAGTMNSFTFGNTSWAEESIVDGKFRGVDLIGQGFNIHHATSGPRGYPNISLDSNTLSFSPSGSRSLLAISTYHSKDDISVVRGRHSWKFGGELRWGLGRFISTAFPAYTFSAFNASGSGNDLADLLLGIPASYSQAIDSESRGGSVSAAVYGQDDFRLSPNLTLNLGLRYEVYGIGGGDRDGHNGAFRPGHRSTVFPSAPPGILFTGDFDPLLGRTMGGAITPAETADFAPRLGLAWSPDFRSGPAARLFGGPHRTSIRVGWGIYYTAERGNANGFNASMPPWFLSVQRDRSILDASGGTLTNPWGVDWDPFTGTLEQRQFYLPLQNIPYAEPGFRGPRHQQWTLSVQRHLPAALMLELAYLGNRSVHLTRKFAANPAIVTADANRWNVESRRMYPDFGAVSGFSADGSSIYHGLQVTTARRFASRLLLDFHYVWSRTLDDASGIGVFQLADRAATPWGRADSDRTHSFAGYCVLDIPSWRSIPVARHALSGWRLTGAVLVRSGLPLQIRNPYDSTLQGFAANMPDILGPFQDVDPREVQTLRLPTGRLATGNFLFDPSIFRTVDPQSPAEARIGNLGRNVFSGPGAANLDVSLSKEFRFTERHRVSARIDATNALNHAQFVAGPATMTNTRGQMFGRVDSTTGGRRIQIQLRYRF